MPIHIDIETDALYLLGIEKGIEKGIKKVREEERRRILEKERSSWIINCWRTGMEPSMISNCLDLPLEQVEQTISNVKINEMTTLMRQNDVFTLTIPKELVTDKMVQKLIRLVNFRELTKNNAMTERQATELAEEIQEKWWAENKDWFLKDVAIS